MNKSHPTLYVLYDGACPRCLKDRDNYLRVAGKYATGVNWFDITDQGVQLKAWGIDPFQALTELHVIIGECDDIDKPIVVSELDAYIILMSRVPMLQPFAWLIGRKCIRPLLSILYRRAVYRRLKCEGRLM
ncbi:DUF393 domain-containing protein [Shewanella eurypsychrophilus]|uniref:DUF393 domain-containing protein n=1 Tax=Shewanella eurypsychrophilus TaxID=2593656 RepID=A0ABX6V4X2_9GAMM|nr:MULTISPECIES: DCC1-like thiol-disulfide oxidoreductase family protein [Shewanella]QFU21590.1 DUF393 domain-containing protein [Shewanella sp. YLB-09]QPG56880.1 DUF393 domain-containing protein [Shewanella eurypsychrophilus]